MVEIDRKQWQNWVIGADPFAPRPKFKSIGHCDLSSYRLTSKTQFQTGTNIFAVKRSPEHSSNPALSAMLKRLENSTPIRNGTRFVYGELSEISDRLYFSSNIANRDIVNSRNIKVPTKLARMAGVGLLGVLYVFGTNGCKMVRLL